MVVKRVVPIIKVSDIRVALDFYCATLGFVTDFKYVASSDGPAYAGVSRDGNQVHLSTFSGDGVLGTSGRKYSAIWQSSPTSWLTSKTADTPHDARRRAG